jgi:ABC-type Mn2+/Zn2+ transport system ATPase subunit
MTALVSLQEVTFSYQNLPAILDVNLTVNRGDFLGIVGPSGSGKTTLLKLIAGVIPPNRGSVRRDVGVAVGYVPQVESVNWYFPLTVQEVVLMARRGHRRLPWPSRSDVAESNLVLDRIGLGGLSGRHIRELSGGQQQRVFIARALLRQANLLLLDEPTSGIDVRARHEIMHVLHDLHHEGIAIVLSTHDLNGIAAHLPRLVCLNREVVAAGSPVDVVTPTTLERLYGAPLDVLSHAGMPVVIESYPEALEAGGNQADALREGHHEHPG